MICYSRAGRGFHRGFLRSPTKAPECLAARGFFVYPEAVKNSRLSALTLLACAVLTLSACNLAAAPTAGGIVSQPAPVTVTPLRYTVLPGGPVAVTVYPGDTVSVSRAEGVDTALIRWKVAPTLAYGLDAKNPAYTFQASAGMVGEYYTADAWKTFLKITY